MDKKIYFILLLTIIISMSCESRSHKETVVLMETSLGNIKVKLYDDTPAHRDNFIKLVEEGYYDGTLFHRVINEFMIQGGDGTSKNAPAGKMLGTGDPGYTIPAEFVYPKYFHKRGALAAARQGRPLRVPSFILSRGKFLIRDRLTSWNVKCRCSKSNRFFSRWRQIIGKKS